MGRIDEAVVEEAAISWFETLGYGYLSGKVIEPEGEAPEREGFDQVVLTGRLRTALGRINPGLPETTLDEVARRLGRSDVPGLVAANRAFHKMLVDGVDVEVRGKAGVRHEKARLVDFTDPESNDFFLVSQFTVIEERKQRRPDLVVFVNGLPVAVLELKNPLDETATVAKAFQQLVTYQSDIPGLFRTNEVLVASDGTEARVGTLTSNKERFLPWRTVEGDGVAGPEVPQLKVLIEGLFEKRRFLDLLENFVAFEDDAKGNLSKKLAGYHQFHAANKAVERTVQAASPRGDKRVGVIWHTQGSGKSLSMLFYAGKIIRHPKLENPTLVVLTDRNDLDEQLFAQFGRCSDLLRQKPVQAESRAQLRELLQVASGGVVFTTIQKFLTKDKEKHPRLSDRRNIVVIADEAHRSQYDFIDGFAARLREALPGAAFIGFTGTPIATKDKNTQAVFGDTLDVYDIQRAVEDGATVRIYYESRLAKLELPEAAKPKIDAEFDEVTEDQEEVARHQLKSRWARLEALVGAEKRLELVARDLVEHFERRTGVIEGKGMIVAMSRRICVELYAAITRLRPAWHDEDDAKGAIKVVMTGSASDPTEFQPHVRSKKRREELAKRLRDPDDPLKLVIVRDMWLTGFDAPCLHTMYVDKPMQGHGLMQAIARVNRVFKDKPGGLVVDYLGLADQLRRALTAYTEGDRKITGIPQEEAVRLLKERYEVVAAMLHGYDWERYFTLTKYEAKHAVTVGASEWILREPEGKKRFLVETATLGAALALAGTHDEARDLWDRIAFFQAIRALYVKTTPSGGRDAGDLDSAIRQIVSKAVASTEVVDIFAAAGLKKPDISILSEEFLKEVRGIPHKNMAVELLKKLLTDSVRDRTRRNVVQARAFSEMLDATVKRYQNRAIEAAAVIEELIGLAKEMNAARARGEALKLTDDELAFYDALEVNDSAVKVLGDEALRTIARELVAKVRANVTIDWTVKETVRAKLRTLVKRVLRAHGYPPDKQEKAVATVLSQAEALAEGWAA